MGMFDYKDYSSSESIELLETSYRLATYANINGFLGIEQSGSIVQSIADTLLNPGMYPNTIDNSLPSGWRELTPAELSLPNSALDATGHYIIESPLLGSIPTGEQAKLLGEYDTQGKLTRVAISYTGTNSLVDVPDYLQLNSGEMAPKLEPLLNALKAFTLKNGLTAEDVIVTGYSLGGGIANLAAEYRETLSGGFFKNANFIGVESPLIYDDASVILNYGYENDVVHRAAGSSDSILTALTEADLGLVNPDKNYSSSIDNTILFDDMYASALWSLPFSFSLLNIPVSWYAHIDGVFTDAYARIADNPFYNLMEKDSATVVANLSALSRGNTWVQDKNTSTSSHYGAPSFIIGSKYDDLLQGGSSNDYIYGGDGNDKIRTGTGTDHVDGGNGINELQLTGTASDWTAYRLSDGSVFMDAKDKSNFVEADHIQNISFENDLASQYNPYVVGNSALIDQRYSPIFWYLNKNIAYQSAIEGSNANDNLTGRIVFGQAGHDRLMATSNPSLLHGGEGNDTLLGYIANDRLYGGEGKDVLVGGKGNDYLNGGVGQDLYQFARGDGLDHIAESSGSDTLAFNSNVNANQLWFSKTGNHLLISVIGSTDQVIIDDWYSNSNFQVETIQSSDGKMLSSSKVDALVNAMSAFSPPTPGQTNLATNHQTALNPIIAANWV